MYHDKGVGKPEFGMGQRLPYFTVRGDLLLPSQQDVFYFLLHIMSLNRAGSISRLPAFEVYLSCWSFGDGAGLIQYAKLSRLEFPDGLHDLFLGIHDKGAVAGDGLDRKSVV